VDLTHKPSKHLIGEELGHDAMLHEAVIFGLIQSPEAHFLGVS